MPRLLATIMLVLVPTAFEARFLFDAVTHESLATHGFAWTDVDGIPLAAALCGFGLAAAGAGAAHAICRALGEPAPDGRRIGGAGGAHVVLAGIAGTYDPDRAPVGSAFAATGARCVGIGAGDGRWHRSAGAMGWSQGPAVDGLPVVGDEISFHVRQRTGQPIADALLLSVATASGSHRAAAARAAAYPGAVAEEMEAFAVGLAARLARRPLTVLRGVSNVAGDRRAARWQTAAALAAVRTLLVTTVHDLAAPEVVSP